MTTPSTTSTSASTFLETVRKSGLVTEAQLKDLFGSFLPADANQAAAALLKAELLTPFQAKHLLAGKFRGFRLGSYKVLRPLGQGGMGAVFLAEHDTLNRKVALKMLPAAHAKDKLALERFLREARAAAALDHPNIVKLFDISQGNGMHFLVLEYVEGKDLHSFLAETGSLHYAQAVQYIAQAATGLQHAHDRGFIHRDIKPANLMLTKDGTVKLLDMGLARSLTRPGDDLTAQLADGGIVGTADYISPEQALEQTVDERSDIYSLGCTFYTLVAGQPPFSGNTTQKLAQHQTKPPPTTSAKLAGRVPPALAEVMAKMMAKKPGERYQTASDVVDALRPWLPAASTGNIVVDPLTRTDLPTAARSSTAAGSASHPARPATRRGPVLLAAGVAAAVLAIGGVIAAATLGGGSKPPNTPVVPPVAQNRGADGPGAPKRISPETLVVGRFRPLGLGGVATAPAGGPLFMNFSHDHFLFEEPGLHTVKDIPFLFPDSRSRDNNIIVLGGWWMKNAPAPPRVVQLAVGCPVGTFHFLGGVSAWGWQPKQGSDLPPAGTTSVVVRLHYAGGGTEDFEWKNGEHLADFYNNDNPPVEVPGSEYVFSLKTSQVRYLTLRPSNQRKAVEVIEFLKGENDNVTDPAILAVTVEAPAGGQPDAPKPDAPKADAPKGGMSAAPKAPGERKLVPIDLASLVNATAPLPKGQKSYTASGITFGLTAGGAKGNAIRLPAAGDERTVSVSCFLPARAVYLLVAPDAAPAAMPPDAAVASLKIRYANGVTEDHTWRAGELAAEMSPSDSAPAGQRLARLVYPPSKPDVIRSFELTNAGGTSALLLAAVALELP